MVTYTLKELEEKKVPEINFKALEAFKVPLTDLIANDYNPNRFSGYRANKSGESSTDKFYSGGSSMMALLMQNIVRNGFLFPLITTWDEDLKKYRIIDGYHRYEALKRLGATEAVIIDMRIPYHEAIQLTVLMNKIKGFHQVEKMSNLVVKLEDLGLQDNEICENLGMEAEEYLRLKQQLGIAHAFKDHVYSKSWEVSNEE